MNTAWNWTLSAFSTVGSWLGWAFGELDGFLIALVAFVAIDFFTGMLRSIVEKQLSDTLGLRGVFQKLLIFVMVALAHTMDAQLTHSGAAIRTTVLMFYITNEGVSLLDNATAIGLPVPDKLRDILENLHKKRTDDDEVNSLTDTVLEDEQHDQ